MTVYGFSDRGVAERLAKLAGGDQTRTKRKPARERKVGPERGPKLHGDGWIMKVESGGITARSGTTAGTGTGKPFFVNDSDVLTEITKPGGGSYSLNIWNLSQTVYVEDDYVEALSIGDRPFVVGPLSSATMYKTPSGGIDGRSGTTISSATCDAYENVSGTLTQVSGETATVYNLSTKPINGDSYIKASRDRNGDLIADPNNAKTGVYQAPGGGIAARSGTTLGSATCTLQSIDGGTLSAESTTETVYNMDTANAVGASAYIQVKQDWEGNLVVDWEAC